MWLKKIKNASVESVISKAQCCFCGEQITNGKPVAITLDLGAQQFQSLWAHGLCLQERLHSSVPFLISEEINSV